MSQTVAFLGLGRMGHPMAANLAAAGFSLRVWNRSRGKGRNIEGALELDSPREAAKGADLVVTMLADDAAVEAVVLRPDGLAQAMREGAIHVGCSTISVALARKLEAAHRELRQHYISAPVFGRPEAAAARQLFIIAGGTRAALERAWPLFLALGQSTFALASPAQASLTKLIGNFFILSTIEMLGEGLVLAEKGDIDPVKLIEVLGATHMGSAVFKGYGGRLAATQYEPAGFAMPLALKDVDLVLEAGKELRTPMPLASLARDHLLAALARGREGWDWGGLASVAREEAGLPPTRK